MLINLFLNLMIINFLELLKPGLTLEVFTIVPPLLDKR